MSEKLTKEQVENISILFEKLNERAEYVVNLLIKVGKLKAHDFDKVVAIGSRFITVNTHYYGEDTDGTFLTEFLYDDEKLDEMKEEIRKREEWKKAKEEEDQAYYQKLKEEDEQRELKRLMKKYPDIVGGK